MTTGIIYQAKSPSGKLYIGQTRKPFHKRKYQHYHCAHNPKTKMYHSPLSKALRKYGHRMSWTVLHKNVPPSRLNSLEITEIKNRNSLVPNGYNATSGGRQKMQLSSSTKEKMSKNNCRYWLGKKQSLEHRKKNSEANKGEKNHFYGKKHSIKTKEKISKKNKGKNSGRMNPNATTYKIQHPDKKISTIITRNNLKKFCKQNNCSFSSLLKHKKSREFILLDP